MRTVLGVLRVDESSGQADVRTSTCTTDPADPADAAGPAAADSAGVARGLVSSLEAAAGHSLQAGRDCLAARQAHESAARADGQAWGSSGSSGTGLPGATGGGSVLWPLQEPELDQALTALGQARAGWSKAAGVLLGEVITRGWHHRAGMSVTDYLATVLPMVPTGELRQWARVVRGAERAKNAP